MAQILMTTKRTLPKGWRWAKLGDVCEPKTNTRDPRLNQNVEFTYIDITSVDSSAKSIIEPKKLLGKDAPSRARQVVQTGDIIVSTTRPNLNAIAKITSEFDGQICSTGFCVLRPIQREIDSAFLYFFVQSSDFVKELSDLVNGALYPAVTDKDVRAREIPLPPLDEQKRIAARLEEQIHSIVQARQAAEESLSAAWDLPSAYLQDVFDKVEQTTPSSWHWAKLGEICQFKRGPFGGSLKKDIFVNQGYKIYEQQHAIKNDFEIGRYFITEEKYKEMEAFAVKPNDLIVSCSGTMGKIAIIPQNVEPGIINQALLKLTPLTNNILSSYLKIYLESEAVQKKYFHGTAGTAIQNVAPVSELKQIKIPVPPIKEQKILIEEIEEKYKMSNSIIVNLESQLAEINELPSALLRQAFAGELS